MNMPRFDHHVAFDHRIDNQIIKKEDLRFHDPDTAEEFATSQYLTDFIPRSVILGATGLHMVLENPEHIPHPSEVFYIDSTPGEG
jgi:hypothetical protein